MVSPADMVLFAAVVRTGSFTRTASSFGITKQSVSERISKLEAVLGVRLLERTTRRLRVTEAGSDYAERCAAIAALVEEANADAQRRQAEPVGTLRISAPFLYGRRYLGPVVAAYLARYPKMRLDLALADRRVDLVAERVDLALRLGELDDTSLASRKLGEGHVYVVAAPSLLRRHAVGSVSSLREVPCIGLGAFEGWDVRGEQVKVAPVLVVNDLEVSCDTAVAGLGVARVPGIVCRDAVADGRLVVLFGPEPVARRPLYAVFPSRRLMPAKTRAFVDLLTAMLAPMSPLDVAGVTGAASGWGSPSLVPAWRSPGPGSR